MPQSKHSPHRETAPYDHAINQSPHSSPWLYIHNLVSSWKLGKLMTWNKSCFNQCLSIHLSTKKVQTHQPPGMNSPKKQNKWKTVFIMNTGHYEYVILINFKTEGGVKPLYVKSEKYKFHQPSVRYLVYGLNVGWQ